MRELVALTKEPGHKPTAGSPSRREVRLGAACLYVSLSTKSGSPETRGVAARSPHDRLTPASSATSAMLKPFPGHCWSSGPVVP